MKVDLNDVEQFQKHFVLPLVDAVRSELKPLVEARADHESRLQRVESNQKKALLGYASIVAVVTVVFNAAWAKIKSKLMSFV